MFPFFSNLVFCPVTLWYENMNFPLTQLITSPLLLTQQCWTQAAVALQWVACAHPSPGAGELQHRTERGAMGDPNNRDLESCHVPSQMWKQFSGRLRDFFLPKLHTPINIRQKCTLSLFVYLLLNTIMVSSCRAGGPIHWNFTVDFFFFFHYCTINVFPPILLYACRMPDSPITPVFYYLSSIILIPHLLCGIWKSSDKSHSLL